MSQNKLSRRNMLKMGLGTTVGLTGVKALGQICGAVTPAQTEGPFYPIVDQEDKDNDLTRVRGRRQSAKGQIIEIVGQITDSNTCNPIEGALVEIWQACHSGRYNHPSDPNVDAEFDPNFQYWGKAITDSQGNYNFLTIKPGHYPANDTWIRPAHVHYKVQKRGYNEITTQMYFKGDPYNDGDLILRKLSPAEQEMVIVNFQYKFEGSGATGRFDIALEPII